MNTCKRERQLGTQLSGCGKALEVGPRFTLSKTRLEPEQYQDGLF
jgi:hypothetical protein